LLAEGTVWVVVAAVTTILAQQVLVPQYLVQYLHLLEEIQVLEHLVHQDQQQLLTAVAVVVVLIELLVGLVGLAA
jgi:hypothetical protein